MIAALALTFALTGHTTPGPQLNDALWMASVSKWNAALQWNAAIEWNAAVEWNAAIEAATHPGATTSHQSSPWDVVAECESSGNWSTDTGNGYYGGLQMTPDFWSSYGGHQYAPRPDLATRAEQIAVAERAGSRTPWPVCGRR